MKEELKCAFTSKPIWISTAIILVCYLSFSIPSWIGSADWGAEFRPSALQQALEAIIFGGVSFLLPFCAAATYATSQVDEIKSNYFLLKISRCSVGRYGWSKILACAISGAAVLGLSYGLHALIWNLISLPYDPAQYPYHELPFREGTFYAMWHMQSNALPVYLYMTVALGLFGAFWAIFGLTASVWFSDKLLTIAIPACFYEIWAGGIFRFLFGWNAPFPSELYYDEINITLFWQTLAVYGALLLIAIPLYFWGLKRRMQHG